MIRNLKILGLTMVAMAAIAGVAAASASAHFHAENAGTTSVTGSQTNTHEFTVNTGTVTCSTANFGGSQSGETAESLTITPVYEGCTNSLLGSMTVNMNGCYYTFTVTETTTETTTDGAVHIICETGKEIEVKRTSGTQVCTVKVPPQTPVGGIEYHNKTDEAGVPKTMYVEVTANVTGLHYTQSGILCLGGTGSFTNGTYTGKVKEVGKNAGEERVGITVT